MGSVNFPPNIPLSSSSDDAFNPDAAVGNTLKANLDRSGEAKAKVQFSIDLNTQALMDLFKPKEGTNVIV